MKQVFILSLCLFFGFFPPELQAQNTPEEKISRFFSNLTTVGYSRALDELFAEDILTYKDRIPELKDSFKNIEEAKGKCNGYELLGKTAVSESLITFRFMARYDNNPMFAKFTFYKPKNRWVLYGFSISEENN